jgi:hypothetical protein
MAAVNIVYFCFLTKKNPIILNLHPQGRKHLLYCYYVRHNINLLSLPGYATDTHTISNIHYKLSNGQFHRGGIIQGILIYTMTPWKTPRKSMGEWDYRTRIIPLLSFMKPGLSKVLFFLATYIIYMLLQYSRDVYLVIFFRNESLRQARFADLYEK